MNSINFDNPWLLLLIIPFLLVAVIPFMWAVKKENRTKSNIISLMIHVLLAFILTLTIAKTSFESVITETNIYVLADVSYSSNRNLEKIDEYIYNIQENSPRNSKLGIIAFGKDYELLVEMGQSLRSVSESKVDSSSTDIASALKYASTLFDKDNVIKRIIVISDGKETNPSDLVNIVHSLSNEDIYIDAVFLDNNLNENSKEIQINSVEYNDSTYLGNSERVLVNIQSSYDHDLEMSDGRGYINLYCDDVLFDKRPVIIYKGQNIVSLNLDTNSTGNHGYRVELEFENDETSFNNIYLFNQSVTDKTSMLFVSGNSEDKSKAIELYGEENEIDFYINNGSVPYTVEGLCKYDTFVLSDVDIRTLSNSGQFIKSIDTLVSKFGKSLVTFGNVYTQNKDDSEVLQSLDGILPVRYGNGANEEKLTTLVIDVSRSMEQIGKLEILRLISEKIIDSLEENSNLMIIQFWGENGFFIQPTIINSESKEELKLKLKKLNPQQGTMMGEAMKFAHEQITQEGYAKNEVVLITDGYPHSGNKETTKEWVTKIAAESIPVSTIQTVKQFNENGVDEAAVFLKEVASIGNGLYYLIENKDQVTNKIESVLNSLEEIILDRNPSSVTIEKPKHQLVNDVSTLPDLNGLINNVAKKRTEVVLEAKYIDEVGFSYNIPLYVTRDYTNGKVSSFTSSLTGDWISNWLENDEGVKVLANIIKCNKPSQRIASSLITNVEMTGTIGNLSVQAPALDPSGSVNVYASITMPNGDVLEKYLSFDSINYVTEFNADVIGKYEIVLSYQYGELEYSSTFIYYVSVLPEYDRFVSFDPAELSYMVSSNGGVYKDGNVQLENNNSLVQKYVLDFTPILMIIAVVLFVSDVIIRKLRWADIKTLFSFNKKTFNARKE